MPTDHSNKAAKKRWAALKAVKPWLTTTKREKTAQNALQSVAYLILAQPYISLQVNSILQKISL